MRAAARAIGVLVAVAVQPAHAISTRTLISPLGEAAGDGDAC